jgi:hypothetical protein
MKSPPTFKKNTKHFAISSKVISNDNSSSKERLSSLEKVNVKASLKGMISLETPEFVCNQLDTMHEMGVEHWKTSEEILRS